MPDIGIDCRDGREHGGTRRDQTAHGSGQPGNALARPQRLPDERGGQCPRQSHTEHHGKAADLVLQGDALADQLLARVISDRRACAGSDFT